MEHKMTPSTFLLCNSCNNSLFPDLQERMHAKKTRGPRKVRGRPKKSALPKKIDCSFCPNKFKRILGYYKHANSAHLEHVAEEWLPCEACR